MTKVKYFYKPFPESEFNPWLCLALEPVEFSTMHDGDMKIDTSATQNAILRIHGWKLRTDQDGNPSGGTVNGFSVYDGNKKLMTASGLKPVDFADFVDNITVSPAASYAYLNALISDRTVVTGSSGNDLIEVGAGNDVVHAGGGSNTVFKWQAGTLKFEGGTDLDTLSFAADAGDPYPIPFTQQLVVNLTTGKGKNPYGGDLTLTSVENVVGTSAADVIVGNNADNHIGHPFDTGADRIAAKGGSDVIELGWAGTGGAKVDGGTGTDEIKFLVSDFSTDSKTLVLDIKDPSKNTFLFAGGKITNVETFTASWFGTGSDTDRFVFRGGDGGETVSGTGVQRYVAEPYRSAVGRDKLYGNGGDDVLLSFGGIDTLDGGSGKDTLEAGAEDDLVTGGKGADTFIVRTGFNKDTVTDFKPGEDIVDARGWGEISGYSSFLSHAKQRGDDVWVVVGSDMLVLQGVSRADLNSADILL